MIREAFRGELAEHLLDREVDFGHEIDRAFFVDADRSAEPRHLDIAGADDDLNRRGQQQHGSRATRVFSGEQTGRRVVDA